MFARLSQFGTSDASDFEAANPSLHAEALILQDARAAPFHAGARSIEVPRSLRADRVG